MHNGMLMPLLLPLEPRGKNARNCRSVRYILRRGEQCGCGVRKHGLPIGRLLEQEDFVGQQLQRKPLNLLD